MGFKQLIQDATHLNAVNNTFSLLDHFCASDPELHELSGVIVNGATDHFIIFNVRKKHKVKYSKDTYQGRAYSKLDDVKFRHALESCSWNDVMQCQDPDDCWNLFKLKFFNILD